MKLRLNVITYRHQPTSMPMGSAFDAAGGTIGRAADNDWVLPDPERFISGKHAKISLQNGQYYLTDTSTNGIYINARPQPIGKGNSVPLTDGDRILICDYEIEVELENTQMNTGSAGATDGDFFSPLPSNAPLSASDNTPFELEDTTGGEITGPTTSSHFNHPAGSPGFSEPDDVAAVNQFFQPPQSTPQSPPSSSQSMPSIPEDWNPLDDDLDDDSMFVSSQLTASVPEPLPVTPAPSISLVQEAPNSDLASLNKLLEGAGLQPLDIPAQQADEVLRLIGSIMREMVSGVMEILRARADIKSEFRMQLTTIRPVENNPLKFSVGVEDAMRHLLGSTNSAYLPPLESVCQAIVDIQAHQMAVMAGMQAALSAMLQKFEPKALEDYFARKGGRSILESKKAWYWEQYGEKHKELLMEAEDNFQDFFGEEFARAYESQITKLAQARKKS